MSQIKWTNGAGGDFATGANWMGGTVPGASDDAIFALAGPYTVTSAQSETVNSVQMVQGITLSITGGTFDASLGSGSGTDNGLILIGNNTEFQAGGTIAGTGTLQLASVGNGTSLTVLDSGLTLSGGGKLVMGDNGNNYVRAASAGDLLTNVNDTISGGGQFGYNSMSFANGAAGVLNANAAATALEINAGSGVITNAGLFEATGNAGLYIYNSSITQTGTGTIKAVGMGHNVSLDGGSITGGTLTTTGGGMIQSVSNGYLTGLTINAGSTIAALNNTYLFVSGTITNKGTIALNSAGNGTRLEVNSGTLTLTGGGAVSLTDNSQNYIYAGSGGDLLININNTISGAGQLTYNQLAFDNRAAGIIDATGTVNALVIDNAGQPFSNEGVIEDTGAGGLQLNDNTVIANSGTIQAIGAGSHVDLNTGSIQGGTLKTTGGGIIQSVNIFGLDGSTKLGAINITTGSQIVVDNNEYLTLSGSIVNGGTIALDSVGNGTRLQISGTVSLTGGGTVLLSDNNQNYLYSVNQSDTLVNVNNVITGSGMLGSNYLAIDNQASGSIVSTGTQGMTFDNGSRAFSNEGKIEDTGTGGLAIVDGTIIANSGTIEAIGTGSHVDLNTGSIQGGTLKTGGGGVIQSVNIFELDGSTALGAVTITANSQIAVLNNEYLTLAGSIVNGGTIGLDSAGNGTRLQINGNVTLTGGGAVLLSDSTQNYVYSVNQSDTLVNLNNTISGSGTLGSNYLAINNTVGGTINSTGTSGLVLDNGGRTFTNAGLIEDTGTGGFVVLNSNVITNTGTILATGTGSNLNLYTGTIVGGTLATSNGGVIDITNNFTLDGASSGSLTLATGSQVAVLNDNYLTLDGTILNHGTIGLDSAGNGTRLQIDGNVTLTGGGTVLLSDSAQNYLYSVTQGDTLVNVNNTISGSGTLGSNYLAINNTVGGTILSTGTSGLVVDNGGRSFINAGLIEDIGTGGFVVVNGNVITNTGTILATGTGSNLNLYAGTIVGGTVATSNGGVVDITNNFTLDGQSNGALTLATGSQVAVLDDQYLTLEGTIANHGTIGLDSTGDSTRLQIYGTVSLTGGGAVLLSDNSQNYLYSVTQSDTLVNVNDVISGSGLFGQNYLTIDNQAAGVIDSTGTAGINVNPGGRAFTNEGTLESTGSGGLFIQATTLTNTGTIAAFSDSFVTINTDAVLTNYSNGTLTGGTYEAVSAGGTHTATVAINSIGTIGTDAATLVLSGAGSSITAGGTAVESTLTNITSKGAFELLGGRTVTRTTALTNGGLILLGGGGKLAFTTGKFTNNGTVQAQSGGVLSIGKSAGVGNLAGGTLTGGTWIATGNGSTIALGNATVTTDAAVITLSGTGSVFSSGTPAASLESTLTSIAATGKLNILSGRNFASTASSLTDSGVLTLGGGTLSATGLTIAAGGTLTGLGAVASAVADNGMVVGTGSGTLTLSGLVSGSGLLDSTGGATVNATGGYAVGTLTVDAGAVLNGSGSVSGATTVNGSLGLGSGTLTANTVVIGSTGALTGGSVNASGAITDNGSVILSGSVAAASLTVATGASLSAAAATIGGAVTDNGTLGIVGTLNAGSIAVAAGATLAAGSIADSGTLTDNGTVSLAGGTLSASGVSVASGATLSGYGSVTVSVANAGTIDANGGTLTLASGESGGALAVEASAALVASAAISAGSLTIAAGGSFIGFGSVGGLTTDNGSLTASGGTLSLTSDQGIGAATIASGATLSVAAALVLGGGVSFTTGGSAEVLALGMATGNTSVISNFGTGTVIDLTGAVANKASFSKGVLTLKEGTTTVAKLDLAGKYTSKNFKLVSDGNGGTDIKFVATKAAISPMADLKEAAANIAATATAPAIHTASTAPSAAALPTAHGWASLDLHLAAHVPDIMLSHQG